MHIFQCSYATLQRAQGSWEPPKVSCRLPLPHMNAPSPVWVGATVMESHVSWKQTQTQNERLRERKRKHGLLGGSAIQVLSEKLHSNLVKEWKGSVVWCWVTFPVVWTTWSSSSNRDQLGIKRQRKSEHVLLDSSVILAVWNITNLFFRSLTVDLFNQWDKLTAVDRVNKNNGLHRQLKLCFRNHLYLKCWKSINSLNWVMLTKWKQMRNFGNSGVMIFLRFY